jgi:hypothetical protein
VITQRALPPDIVDPFPRFGIFRKLRVVQEAIGAYVMRRTVQPVEYCVSPADDVIYVINPKAACTSIVAEILRHNGHQLGTLDIRGQLSLHDLAWRMGLKPSRRKLPDAFMFSIVRNPVTRLVSFYEDKFCSFLEARYASFELEDYLGGVFRPTMTFEQVARIVARIPDRLADRHFKSQSYLLTVEVPRVDYVGRLENIADVARDLRDKIDLSGLSRLLATEPKPFSAYYDRKLFDVVCKRYRQDIERFGYAEEVARLRNQLVPVP